jgi:hypothetical protein
VKALPVCLILCWVFCLDDGGYARHIEPGAQAGHNPGVISSNALASHIIYPTAGLQPFEKGSQAFLLEPARWRPYWQEEADARIELHDDSPSLPHEIAYARALGLPSDEGRIPWAAFESQTLSQPCAWVHPCHLDVGMTDMVMQPTHLLHLSDQESRELHALIAPYFEQDGITLRYYSATRWLAHAAQFADFECTSLARVQGRSINEFLPDPGEFAQQLELSRLQAEVQMLLYTHPLTEARQARGLPTVNSFWVDGAGALDALPAAPQQVRLDFCLQEALHDAKAYLQAWQSLVLSAEDLAAKALAQHQELRLTLCGERQAITYVARPGSWRQWITRFLTCPSSQNRRELL